MSSVSGNETVLVDRFLSMRDRWLLYLGLFLLALLIRIASFTGLSLTDDLWYSRYAQLISQGIFSPDASHPGLRVGVTVPIGIVYRMFGISEWTTIVFPLIASSLSVPLLVAVGRKIFSMQAALLAGLLLATLPTHVTYATILVPEPIVELYILIGVFLYVLSSERSDSIPLAVLAGLCFGVAYMAKEIALFIGGAFVLWSIVRARWKLALATTVGMAVVGALEMALYLFQTGDPLFRSHAIASSQELYFATVGGDTSLEWRLFKAYPYLMLLPSREFAFHSLIGVSLAIVSLLVVRSEKVWMVMFWAAIPMLYLNFGSSSLSNYAPVALAERYIGVVYYPLLLLASVLLTRWLSQPSASRARIWSVLALLNLGGITSALITSRGWTSNTEDLAVRALLAFGPLILSAIAIVSTWLLLPNWPRIVLWSILVMLVAAGLLGSFASRNMQTYSEEVLALRAILERAQAGSFQIVRFEGERGWRWRFAMELLAGKQPEVVECPMRCLVVRPDATGLPFATDVPGARPEEPAPLEGTFLP